MPRIVVPDDQPAVLQPSQAFHRLAGFDARIYSDRPASADQLVERIREAEVVLNIRATSRFTLGVLVRCSRLRLISIWGTGTDNVDLDAARDLGIRVTNTPGVAAISVAEHTLMLIMAAARRLTEMDPMVRQGHWPRGQSVELHGKTLGLVGVGAIGGHVARLGRGIGMNVIAWSFHPRPERAAEFGFRWASLESVLRDSDVVSIHVRHSPQTGGMIGRDQLALMKRGALLVNTARGAIVDENALVQSLRSGHLAGAGLDVFVHEPLPPGNPLLSLSNVVLTPHSAGITPEAIEAGLELSIDNIFRFWDGQAQNVVA